MYSVKEIKKADGTTERLSVALETYTEKLIVNSNNDATIDLFSPTIKEGVTVKRDYTPGSVNMFVTGHGYILRTDIEVKDLEGKPLIHNLTIDGYSDKSKEIASQLAFGNVIHKHNEDDRKIDKFSRYIDPLPDVQFLNVPAVAPTATTLGVPSFAFFQSIPVSKKSDPFNPKNKELGYEYPGIGLRLTEKDRWILRLRFPRQWKEIANGIEIHAITSVQRIVDARGK